ncbi:hypothetical protein JY651_48670 [Pyxidicoccus parkwayensis]|uniref:DUF7151 domain-containing protein n=1 Tax=Pyxidicoccus parkwayensis TaxID=2813578 RepID=A0ABX7NVI9_9BACT|nr:hypothetical protein [Pyxidicoccus parkwaysis]QSQ22889.1 hypothetical protein JY651_48670 [Pyxidicoccus parkwaysis]
MPDTVRSVPFHPRLAQARSGPWLHLALGLLLGVTACSKPEGAWMEVPGEEPSSLNCPHGARVLLSGRDDNENGRLDEDEVRERTRTCASPVPLSATREEPPGEHCEHGGTALQSGLDVDGDGALAPAEVTSVQYVCERAAPTLLSRVRSEPAGENCPTGGSAVESGLDVDGDGELSREEVTTTRHVCGVRALLRVAAEPPGERCPVGGTVAQSGPDLDGDGALDDAEVESTRYVCDARALTRVDVEPPGPRCPGGGAVVHTGGDTNGDGVLQNEEVRSSETLCERVIDGDVRVSTQLELASLQDVTVITGSLYIAGRGVVNVELPAEARGRSSGALLPPGGSQPVVAGARVRSLRPRLGQPPAGPGVAAGAGADHLRLDCAERRAGGGRPRGPDDGGQLRGQGQPAARVAECSAPLVGG